MVRKCVLRTKCVGVCSYTKGVMICYLPVLLVRHHRSCMCVIILASSPHTSALLRAATSGGRNK